MKHLISRRALAIVGLAVCVARGAAADEMGGFSGLARVTCASGGVGYAAAMSEDLPGPGWENRWHIVLSIDVPASCLRELEIRNVWVVTAAQVRGSYSISIPGWGAIEILPGSPSVRAAFKRASSVMGPQGIAGTETRFKPRIVLQQVGDALELLLEEPR